MGRAQKIPEAEGAGARVRTVVLRHELPDGNEHYDWLIASGTEEGSPLVTFQCARSVQEVEKSAELERIADHRWVYLEFEGEISGNRGSVRRVAEGNVEIVEVGWIDAANAGKSPNIEALSGKQLRIEWRTNGENMKQMVRLEWGGGGKWNLFVIAENGPMRQNRE
ncbi:MAG TPA: hypothetical protein VG711_01680 [Phycisphaerales bacterium]|nr:hypothetical protein [Phycisphaerales bacterium]